MDNAFLSFEKMAKEAEKTIEREAYLKIAKLNPPQMKSELVQAALELAAAYRTSRAQFDSHHDRECEIREGYLQRTWMLHALRSFAWTLAEHANRNQREIASYTASELRELVEFCKLLHWKCYYQSGQPEINVLCSTFDLHVCFIDNEHDEHDILSPYFELYALFSLEELRNALLYIYPAIRTLWLSNRTGDAGDIIYAWCSLAYASRAPFFHDDGPNICFFHQNSDVF